MIWLVVFTLAVLAFMFWGALIIGALIGLFRIALWVAINGGLLAYTLAMSLLWCVMFPFAPRRAMAALRGEEFTGEEVRRDPTVDPTPHPFKIYRANRRPAGRP